MKCLHIIDLLHAIEGPIKPIADSAVDSVRQNNLYSWCEAHNSLVDELIECGDVDGIRIYASAREVSDYARKHLKSVYDYIGIYLEKWEREANESELQQK